MDRLIEGFQRFRKNYYEENRVVFDALSRTGQAPRALVIACCDSRVDPSLIFDTAPGEVFTIRNIANLIPPYAPNGDYHGTSAALEFAIRILLVEHVVVLGHSGCGGVRALVENALEVPTGDFVGQWMAIANPARERAFATAAKEGQETLRHTCELEVVKVSLANLMTFPWVAERASRNALALHGWYFDLENGALLRCDLATGKFAPVGCNGPKPCLQPACLRPGKC
jgi:carbonic anhydrase